MENTSENKPKKHICAALLAHVDAGKTTLSEAVLYLSGMIRECGRVDKKNAFLDNFELERERGITIFSKQAVLALGDMQVTLLGKHFKDSLCNPTKPLVTIVVIIAYCKYLFKSLI